jgi:hypothetical protein
MPDFEQVPVPSEHVLKVYALLAELQEKSITTQEPGTISGDESKEWWPSEDLLRLGDSPRESVRRVAQVMDVLAKVPGVAISLTEVSDATGLSRGELRGGFSGFTRWVKSEFPQDSRGWPFKWSTGEPKHPGIQSEFYYAMDKGIARKWLGMRAGEGR